MARKIKSYELPYGEGSIHQRASDGIWIGTIEVGWTSTGTRRRITVSSRDKDTAWGKLIRRRRRQLIA